MSRFKKIFASISLTFAILLGGAVAANAYTTYKDAVYVGNYTYAIWVTVDYDWWEETFQGKRDYRFFSHYIYCSPGRICVY
jgi:hypothetical protein